jgi:hypothetical protein
MPINTTLLRILRVTPENREIFAKLLQYFDYVVSEPIQFEAKFLIYGSEIIDHQLSLGDGLVHSRSNLESTYILQRIFTAFPVANLWDLAFNFRLFAYADEYLTNSVADLQAFVAENAIQTPLYLPFVRESRGMITWRHQAANILNLFFGNRHVVDHYIRELGAKRISARERLNQIEMPTGHRLGDYLCKHSFHNGIFITPNLQAGMHLWRIVNGNPHASNDVESLMKKNET